MVGYPGAVGGTTNTAARRALQNQVAQRTTPMEIARGFVELFADIIESHPDVPCGRILNIGILTLGGLTITDSIDYRETLAGLVGVGAEL